MKSNKFNPLFLLFLIALSTGFVACSDDLETIEPYESFVAVPKTETGKRLVDETGLISTIYQDTSYTVVDGLQATELHYLSAAGVAMKISVFEIDLTNPDIVIEASTPNNSPAFGRQQMTVQAGFEDREGHKVWGGINGDFFDAESGTPRGILYKEGMAIRTIFPDIYTTFFGILENGKAVAGNRSIYESVEGELMEAVGARAPLVTDGILVPQTDFTVEPRTCIGVSEDGNTVYVMVVDGRNFHYSNGMNYETLGTFMRALGAYNAVNLDGGGSSTFFVRNTPTFAENRFEIRNWPSDNGGQERAVANGLLFISKTH